MIEASTGNIFVAAGNGPYNGKTNWGDAHSSSSTLTPPKCWATTPPADNAELNDRDLDLGSTSPVLLGGDYLAQGGKDALIRVLSMRAIAGTPQHMKTTSCRPYPHHQEPACSLLLWCGTNKDRRGCLPPTTGVLPLGRSKTASSLRSGRTATAAPARCWLAACCTSIVPREDYASTNQPRELKSPTSRCGGWALEQSHRGGRQDCPPRGQCQRPRIHSARWTFGARQLGH